LMFYLSARSNLAFTVEARQCPVRPGSAHWNFEFAVEVRQSQLRSSL
jgi:hypothetical protein